MSDNASSRKENLNKSNFKPNVDDDNQVKNESQSSLRKMSSIQQITGMTGENEDESSSDMFGRISKSATSSQHSKCKKSKNIDNVKFDNEK